MFGYSISRSTSRRQGRDIYIDSPDTSAYTFHHQDVLTAHHGEHSLSPTIFLKAGHRFFFYANERHEPPHIHVQRHDAVAQFWLNSVSLAKNHGMTPVELSRAFALVEQHETIIMEKWNGVFSRKKNT